MSKLLFIAGSLLLVAGFALFVAARFNIPIGRLPGDISIQKGRTTFYFPIVTCILISVLLTAISWFVQSRHK